MFIFNLSINPVLNVPLRMYIKFIKAFANYSGNFVVIFLTVIRTETLRDLLKICVKEGLAEDGIGVNCACRYKRVQL